MAVIASDNFNRADDPTSLGTADTGQTWTSVTGTWGISSAQAVHFDSSGTGRAVLETGFTDCITKITLVNPTSVGTGGGGMGLICRYFDTTHYWRLTYERFPGNANRLRLHRVYGGTATVIDVDI